jgi:hypothetical protein
MVVRVLLTEVLVAHSAAAKRLIFAGIVAMAANEFHEISPPADFWSFKQPQIGVVALCWVPG